MSADASAPEPSRGRSRSLGRRLLRLAGLLAALGVIGALVAAGAVYWTFLRDLPDLASLDDYRPPLASVVLDREGRPIGEFFEERRHLVAFEELPPHAIDAFVAAEDDTFFEHAGIDYPSILRAAWANLRAGGQIEQGASTITQQMVKQLLLSSERTYRRKVREMILARRIEQRFSKQEILYLYLNQIYFGSGAHGIGEAARTYFGKEAADLEVGESALLAGLPKAPGRNSPHRDPQAAEARRLYVLTRMHEEALIDTETYEAAVAAQPEIRPPGEPESYTAAAYFTEQVRRRLVDELGSDAVLRGGLVVETTVDLELQREAVRAVRSGLQALAERGGYAGPLRTVPTEELNAEVARVGVQNGLVDPEGPAAELGDVVQAGERPWFGVVVEVARKARRARVALAPGQTGSVRFEDLTWARRLDKPRAKAPSRIDEVFAVGDVARFRYLSGGTVPEDTKDEASEPTPLVLALHQPPEAQGALLSFSVPDGDVLALVGGYDFAESEFDRAVQARRQPGSAFKPLIYGAAVSRGYTPASILYDRPVIYDDPESGFTWRPENYGRRFLGPLLLSDALARSVNNATIHLLRDIGVGRVLDYARTIGIRSPLERNLSIALGASPVSLLELTEAYAAFASGGLRVAPRFVLRVVDRDGEVLLENLYLEEPDEAADAERSDGNGNGSSAGNGSRASTEGGESELPAPGERVLEQDEAYVVVDLLREVVEHPRGTGRRARSLGRPVAGKTGTTNEQGDAWFMGFSPELVTGVWVGHDESEVLGRGETGGRAALPIWIDFMREALAERPRREFPVPDGVIFARIDARTGRIATASAEDARFHAFRAGTVPSEQEDESGEVGAGREPDPRRRLQLDF